MAYSVASAVTLAAIKMGLTLGTAGAGTVFAAELAAVGLRPSILPAVASRDSAAVLRPC